jgi:ribonuclease D
MTSEQKELFQKAKNTISKISVSTKFSEQFLLTNSNLRKIILDKDAFDKTITGWRRELFGNELQKLIY